MLIALLTGALLAPVAGSATVTVGSSMGIPNNNLSCPAPPCTRSQSVLPGRLTTSPVTGQIVAWRATVSPTTRAQLRVISPFGGGLKFITTGPVATPGTSSLSAAVSLPITAGDRIGVDLLEPTTAGLSALRMVSPVAGASWDAFSPTPADGVSAPAPTATADQELLLAADVQVSNQPSVSSVKYNKKKGTAKVTLNIPNPGQLLVLAPQGKKQLVKPQAIDAPRGEITLNLRPGKDGKSQLHEKGKAKGTVLFRLTLQPAYGDPPIGETQLKLKLKS